MGITGKYIYLCITRAYVLRHLDLVQAKVGVVLVEWSRPAQHPLDGVLVPGFLSSA